ncbi:MAG: phosphoglucosamine mutase [Gammaproteobacteria bacterium]|nr:phosphoglucosamine mutase [Gammaproteobacteria bacterium]
MSESRASLFGTDGIRGRVGREPITAQTVMKLGWAAGSVLAATGHPNKVLIGKDTRVSGYLLESALEAGFSAAGVDICLLGPLPTPGIACLTRTARAGAGIVISASHNPYYDNGVKFFSSTGAKMQDELTARIDAMMSRPMTCVDSSRLGKAERLNDAQGRYIEFCKGTLPPTRRFSDLKIVVDCANGAAYEVAPRVFSEMGAEVTAIGNQPDGFNINRECGSTHLQALMAKVVEVGADIGIALDGDADRVLLVDAGGTRVDGDQILYLLARRRQRRGALGGGVVGTAMTNLGLELALAEMGVAFARAPVGDRHVHKALTENRWLLGGESSGHIICLDKSTTGDGIIAALEVLEAMRESRCALRELVAGLAIYPQLMVNVPVSDANGGDLVRHERVTAAVRRAESELSAAGRGRVVIRPSGTEPMVRVLIEGEDRRQLERLAREVADTVEAVAALG